MFKRSFAASITAVLTLGQIPSAAQKPPRPRPCSLTVAQSPKIRGLRLGMSVAEAISVLPAIKTKHARDLIPDVIDNVYVMLQPPLGDDETGKLAGLEYLSLGFVDDKLYDISSTYTLSWPTIDAFALKLSETLKLPTSWEKTYEGKFRSLKCNGFSVHVSDPFKPYLSISIPAMLELVKSRAEMSPEQQLKEKTERKRVKSEALAKKRQLMKEAEDNRNRKVFKP